MLTFPVAQAPTVAKVADFGLSSRLFATTVKETEENRRVDNPVWTAPEIVSECPFTEKSDIYSFGIILWELVTREFPVRRIQLQSRLLLCRVSERGRFEMERKREKEKNPHTHKIERGKRWR